MIRKQNDEYSRDVFQRVIASDQKHDAGNQYCRNGGDDGVNLHSQQVHAQTNCYECHRGNHADPLDERRQQYECKEPPSLALVSAENRSSGKRRVLGTEAKRRIFDCAGQQDQNRERDAEFGARARGLHQVGDTDRGRGEQESGTQALEAVFENG